MSKRSALCLAVCAVIGCSDGSDQLPQALLDQQAAHGWGPAHCAEPMAEVSAGFSVRDQLGELVLKSCAGADVSLREFCGADAFWISTAHAWCPHCRVLAGFAQAVHDSRAASNLASLHILVESSSGEAPDEDDCEQWRDAYGHTDVITVYDPDGRSLGMFEENFTALNVFVDGKRVIDGKLHTDVQSDIEAAIDRAFGQ